MEPLANMQLVMNEISIRNNGLPNGDYQLLPKFQRRIGMQSDTAGFVELTVEMVNTPENPFPFDLKVSMTGSFDLGNFPREQYDEFMKVTAVQIMLPYIRSVISSVTSGALMPPIILPIVDVRQLFPE